VERGGGGREIWVIGGQDNESVMQDCWALELDDGMAWRQVHVRCGRRRGSGGAAAGRGVRQLAAAAQCVRAGWRGGQLQLQSWRQRCVAAARHPANLTGAPTPAPYPRDERSLLLRTAHSAEPHPRQPSQIIIWGARSRGRQQDLKERGRGGTGPGRPAARSPRRDTALP
jgi:hypothetical protein